MFNRHTPGHRSYFKFEPIPGGYFDVFTKRVTPDIPNPKFYKVGRVQDTTSFRCTIQSNLVLLANDIWTEEEY